MIISFSNSVIIVIVLHIVNMIVSITVTPKPEMISYHINPISA